MGKQINEYTTERVVISNDDLLDVDATDDAGVTFESQKLKYSTLETQILTALGTGVDKRITIWSGTNSQTHDANLVYDYVNDIFLVGSQAATSVNYAAEFSENDRAGVIKIIQGRAVGDNNAVEVLINGAGDENIGIDITASGATVNYSIVTRNNAPVFLSEGSGVSDPDDAILNIMGAPNGNTITIGRKTGGGHIAHTIKVAQPKEIFTTTVGGDLFLQAGDIVSAPTVASLDGGDLYLRSGRPGKFAGADGTSNIIFQTSDASGVADGNRAPGWNTVLTIRKDKTIQYLDGNEADGFVLTSNATGVATWQASGGGGGNLEATLTVGDFTGAENILWSQTGAAASFATQTGSRLAQLQMGLWDGAPVSRNWDIQAQGLTVAGSLGGAQLDSMLAFRHDSANRVAFHYNDDVNRTQLLVGGWATGTLFTGSILSSNGSLFLANDSTARTIQLIASNTTVNELKNDSGAAAFDIKFGSAVTARFLNGGLGVGTTSFSARFIVRGTGTGTVANLIFEDNTGQDKWTLRDDGSIFNHNVTGALIANPGDGYQQYSADIVAGNAAPHFRTEVGNVIKLYTTNTYTRNAAVVENRTLLASSAATTTNNNNVLAALLLDINATGLITLA